jgi:hypothetical protein
MTCDFEPGRLAFAALRGAFEIDAALKADVSRCLELLLSRYNTQIYENRFVVGGVTERIIAAAFLAMGTKSKATGVHVTRTDISVGGANLSVKGAFSERSTTIRLVNVMGNSANAKWDESTIFVVSGLGIGYADPQLLPNTTRRTKDAIVLSRTPLKRLWLERPEYLYPLEIQFSRADKEGSDIASRLIADEILRYAKRLKPFDLRSHED